MTTLRSTLRSTLAVLSIAGAACGGTSDISFPREGPSPLGPTTSPSTVDDASAPANEDAAALDSTDGGPLDAAIVVPLDAGTLFDAAIMDPLDAFAPDPFLDATPISISTTPDAGDVLSGLKAITATCTVASNGTYATDRSATAAIDICKLNGAFFWTADLAIDCDGQKTAECNSTTDATFEAETTVTQSNGQPLISSELPFVVVPLPSSRFDYTKENIQPGALAIVIYGDQIVYGIFGDEGPTGVIGDASYAMAASLGMSTNPKTGGTAGAVTYIVLTGKGAVVSPAEAHAAAVTVGGTLTPALIANN
jgi:Fungal chitosanase of glycosyl hydrolase group 75